MPAPKPMTWEETDTYEKRQAIRDTMPQSEWAGWNDQHSRQFGYTNPEDRSRMGALDAEKRRTDQDQDDSGGLNAYGGAGYFQAIRPIAPAAPTAGLAPAPPARPTESAPTGSVTTNGVTTPPTPTAPYPTAGGVTLYGGDANVKSLFESTHGANAANRWWEEDARNRAAAPQDMSDPRTQPGYQLAPPPVAPAPGRDTWWNDRPAPPPAAPQAQPAAGGAPAAPQTQPQQGAPAQPQAQPAPAAAGKKFVMDAEGKGWEIPAEQEPAWNAQMQQFAADKKALADREHQLKVGQLDLNRAIADAEKAYKQAMLEQGNVQIANAAAQAALAESFRQQELQFRQQSQAMTVSLERERLEAQRRQGGRGRRGATVRYR